MKNLFSISILLFLLLGCSEDSNLLSPIESNIYREIAYNSLDESTKQSVKEDWRYLPVQSGKFHADQNLNKIIINSETAFSFIIYNQSTLLSENQALVAVTFHTLQDPLLGPLVTIIDYNSKIIIGGVPRM